MWYPSEAMKRYRASMLLREYVISVEVLKRYHPSALWGESARETGGALAMQKFIENLEEAERINRSVDHLVYVAFQLFKDKKILLKVLEEIKKSITKTISAILQYDFIYKRIKLSENQKTNFDTFIQKCAPRYSINQEEINKINEIFDAILKHSESAMEFTRREKVVILSPDMQQKSISLEQIKDFLQISKTIAKKARDHMMIISEGK